MGLWDTVVRGRWQDDLGILTRGSHLGLIQSKLQPSPWTYLGERSVESGIVGLPFRHSVFEAHLHHLELVDSPHCQHRPTVSETPALYLLDCPVHYLPRHVMQHSLGSEEVFYFDLSTLLDSFGLPTDLRYVPFCLLGNFLLSTGGLEAL